MGKEGAAGVIGRHGLKKVRWEVAIRQDEFRLRGSGAVKATEVHIWFRFRDDGGASPDLLEYDDIALINRLIINFNIISILIGYLNV